MKNLKRALSMVLASAMLVGMMVVGTGAAYTHDDVKAEHNVEAIEVLTAAGIMGANDNFEPDAFITRNEMAVVMSNMMGYDVKDFAGASSFTDVPAWAADYVDACYANKIVSGANAEGTLYNGSANVTTAEASLMMLKALGYFEYKGFQDWKLDTIKQASKIDLLEGIDAKADSKLTRNEVAQLALNALEATVVEETVTSAGASIKGDGLEVNIPTNVETDEVTTTKPDYNKTNGDTDGTLQLIEKLFDDDYTKSTGGTDLGLPAIEWKDTTKKAAEQTIVCVADDADEVVIAEKAYANGKALYVDVVDEDFEETVTDQSAAAITAGDVVYFYEKANGKDFDAYVVEYGLLEVTKVDTKMNKAEIEEGYSAEITVKILLEMDGTAGTTSFTVYDTDFVGYPYEKGDVILANFDDTKTDEVIYDSELAEIVEGKVTAKKGTDYTIDGTAYEKVAAAAMTVKSEYAVTLNKADQIIYVDTIEEAASSDFAYIYNVVENEGKTNEDGVDLDTTYTAYMVLADGTKASYIVAELDNELAEAYKTRALALDEKVVAYEINSDDELEIDAFATGTDEGYHVTKADFEAKTLDKNNKYLTYNGKNIYADSKTQFIFANVDNKTMKVTTETGINNVKIAADNLAAIYEIDEDGKFSTLLYVFVKDEASAVDTDVEYAVVLDAEYTETSDDDDTYYTYSVWTTEGVDTLTFKDADALALSKIAGYGSDNAGEGYLFAYKMVDGYAKLEAGVLVTDEIDYVGEGFCTLKTDAAGEGDYIADEAELYNITISLDADGKFDGVDVTEIEALESEDDVMFKATDDEMEVVFVIEIDD